MAAQSTLKNMVLSLTLVCLLCSAILGVVYVMTQEPIAKASEKALVEALSMVLPSDGEISTEAQTIEAGGVKYEYYTQSVDGQPSAWAVKSIVNGFGGPLTVLVGVGKDGVVQATKVLSHSETPGLGAKCQTDEAFIAQFEGLDPAAKKLLVTKDGGDIDAITASTITSRAYTLAVSNAVSAVTTICGQQVGSASGASVKAAEGAACATEGPLTQETGPSAAAGSPKAVDNNNGGEQ